LKNIKLLALNFVILSLNFFCITFFVYYLTTGLIKTRDVKRLKTFLNVCLCDCIAESTVIVGSNKLCWLPRNLSKEFSQIFPKTTCRNESKNYLTVDYEGQWCCKGGVWQPKACYTFIIMPCHI